MKHFLLTWLGTAVALLITANVVPRFFVRDFVAALVAVAIIGLVNAFIRPIFSILAFPITLITFGLFTMSHRMPLPQRSREGMKGGDFNNFCVMITLVR